MKFNERISWWTGMVLLIGGCLSATLCADDNKPDEIATPAEKAQPAEKKKELRRTEIKVIAIPSAGKHWIGIHAMPVNDEALRAQLDLQGDRLIVVQVVPDSPSAKAGVKQHDILVRFGDKELGTLEDLVKAVNENGEKEAKLEVLRGGKSVTIPIHPAKRPQESELGIIGKVLPQDLRVYVDSDNKGNEQGRYTLRMIGPGITAAKAFAHGHGGGDFPNGLSLSVTKENDQPAKIVAKKDGKTYETTGDKLNELPDEIRPHVERLLHSPHVMAFSLDDMKKFNPEGARIHAEVHKAVEAAKKQAEEVRARHEGEAKEIRSRIEVRRADGTAIDALRKELESLKSEVQKLKDGDRKDSKDESAK